MTIGSYLRERLDDPETGSTVTIYDATHPDNDEYTEPDDEHWVVCCEDHEIYESFEDYEDARKALQAPSSWCEECAGKVGKIAPIAIRFPDDNEEEIESETVDTDAETVTESPLRCESCNRSPAIQIRVRSTGGVFFFRTLRTSREVALCKECGLAAFKGKQLKSAGSMLLVNLYSPYALAQNQKWITRLKQLVDPAPATPEHTIVVRSRVRSKSRKAGTSTSGRSKPPPGRR